MYRILSYDTSDQWAEERQLSFCSGAVQERLIIIHVKGSNELHMYRTSTQCIGFCHMTHLTNGQKNDNCHSVQVQCEKG